MKNAPDGINKAPDGINKDFTEKSIDRIATAGIRCTDEEITTTKESPGDSSC